MGIRAKILMVFLLGFGSVGGLTLLVLQHRMQQGFDTMERRNLEREAVRVLRVLEAASQSLVHQTRDWAEWTDMYDYARAPKSRQGWAAENINALALDTADLTVVAVLDSEQRVLLHLVSPSLPQPLQLGTDVLAAYSDALRAKGGQARCGLANSAVGTVLMCWARITRSDLSGDFVGTLAVGRLLDARRLTQWKDQTGAELRWVPSEQVGPSAQYWMGVLPPNEVGDRNIRAQESEHFYALYLPVYDHRRQIASELEIRLPRILQERAAVLQREVLQAATLSAVAVAAVLGFLVHLLLVRRLRVFAREMVWLERSGKWDQRISVHGRDELGVLADEVNKVLAMVESQVEDLTAQSMTDTLTALPNRRAFDARLALEFGRSRRLGQSLALLVLDVDYFKRYNDRYGHPAGDVALQTLASVLRQSCARAVDLAARTGGEEFAVLLPATDVSGAVDMARRIQRMLQARNVAHEDSAAAPLLTVSIGIATMGMVDESPQSLVERADRALYTAKALGRNRYHCDVPALDVNTGQAPLHP